MIYQIEISLNKGFKDVHGLNVKHDISYIGIKENPDVKYIPVYLIEGNADLREINNIAKNLLIDPITEHCIIKSVAEKNNHAEHEKKSGIEVEVWFKQGVTDVVSESVLKAIKDLGINKEIKIKTGRKYVFTGKISAAVVKQITERLLVNPMIQKYEIK
jgi:phosphoribosylformylglycinamidine synthase